MLLLVAVLALQATAAIPNNYYNSALGKNDQELMSSLHKIVRGHYMIYYSKLWEKFKTTDCNGNIIIDRYSNSQFTYGDNQCGQYSGIGQCYNREHSVPNSWWGAAQDTMYSDLYHMYPVDGWVNAERGNYPFGDCANGSPRGTGKVGTCTHSGYSGTVFEVADEYKGDFARTYFYMVVRYMDRVGSWTQDKGSVVFTNSSYKHLTPWAISQLLEWHRNDPVSTLESNRNEAVYGIQHNRNPFIDHPELAEYLWGNKTGNAWTGSSTNTPVISSPANGSTIHVGTNTGDGVSKAGRLTISSSEVSSNVTLTATYNTGGSGGTETIETWEGISTYQSYTTTFIQGHAFKWNTSDVGIWSGDTHANGTQSCRFGKTAASYIEMAEDVTDGASKISFYAAKWGSDATPTLQVLYSTNGGSTWTSVGNCSPNGTWQQYIFNLNVTGNVRFKINQTAGSRLNIDDIAITSNVAPEPDPSITISPIGLIEAEQGGESSIVRATVTSENNNENITLKVDGNFQISLNKTDWSTSLQLDPSGEVFYVRLANTATAGEYEGTVEAKTSRASAYADVEGIVNEEPVMLGDVNMDGDVSISDVTTLIDYLLSGSMTSFDAIAADVNQDDAISIADVTALIDMLLNPSAMKQWDAVPTRSGVLLENSVGESIEIYNMDGDCIKSLTGDATVKLPAGIYVVVSENASRKVVVK